MNISFQDFKPNFTGKTYEIDGKAPKFRNRSSNIIRNTKDHIQQIFISRVNPRIRQSAG